MHVIHRGAGVALTWRYWTYEVPGDEEGAPPEQELRPANQRLALACFHIGIGSVVALRLINVRRSHARKLWLFPGSVPGNYRRATWLPPLDTIVVENYSLFNPRTEFTLERNAYRFTGHRQDAILRLTPPGGREDGFVLLTQGVRIDGKPVSRDEALREILNLFQKSKVTTGNTSTKTKAHVSLALFTERYQIDWVKVEEKEAILDIYRRQLMWDKGHSVRSVSVACILTVWNWDIRVHQQFYIVEVAHTAGRPVRLSDRFRGFRSSLNGLGCFFYLSYAHTIPASHLVLYCSELRVNPSALAKNYRKRRPRSLSCTSVNPRRPRPATSLRRADH